LVHPDLPVDQRPDAPERTCRRRAQAGPYGGARPSRDAFKLSKEDPAVGYRRRVLDLLACVTELGCHDAMSRPPSSAFKSHRLVCKARAILGEQVQDNPMIESVALELGVTNRSLQRCFLGILGVSPKQYFRLYPEFPTSEMR